MYVDARLEKEVARERGRMTAERCEVYSYIEGLSKRISSEKRKRDPPNGDLHE